MRETNFITASDGQTKVDLSCLSGSRKTVFFPLEEWVARLQIFMIHLDNVNNMDDASLRAICVAALEEFIETYIGLRRAWAYGHDVEYNLHVNQLYPVFLTSFPDTPIDVVKYSANKSRKEGDLPLTAHKKKSTFKNALKAELKAFDTFYPGTEEEVKTGESILRKFIQEFARELDSVLDPNYYMTYEVSTGSMRSQKTNRAVCIINHIEDYRILEWTKKHERINVDNSD